MATKKVIVKNPTEKIVVRAAGARGPAGGNAYLDGHGIPSNAIGNNGDKYLDLDTSLLYTKVSGIWDNPAQSVARSTISYIHTQNDPQEVWYILHSLGFHPAVSVMDFAGTNVECEVKHDSDNQVELSFYQNGIPVKVVGIAYLS